MYLLDRLVFLHEAVIQPLAIFRKLSQGCHLELRLELAAFGIHCQGKRRRANKFEET